MLEQHEDDMSPLSNEQYSRLRNRVQVVEEKIGQLAEELAELVTDMYSVYVSDKPLDASKDDTVSCDAGKDSGCELRKVYRPFESLHDFVGFAPSFKIQRRPGKVLLRESALLVFEIVSVSNVGVTADTLSGFISFDTLFKNWVFADGTPCGVPTL